MQAHAQSTTAPAVRAAAVTSAVERFVSIKRPAISQKRNHQPASYGSSASFDPNRGWDDGPWDNWDNWGSWDND